MNASPFEAISQLAARPEPQRTGPAGAVDAVDTTAPRSQGQGLNVPSDGATDQLQPANTNVTDNDAPPVNFCKAKTPQTYGATANFGTPKALNVCLP